MAPRSSLWTSGLWAAVAAAAMVAWIGYRNVAEDRDAAQAPYQAILDARSPDEQALLERLLGEAYAVLRSDAFTANLRSLGERYPTIYAKASEQAATPETLARIVSLEKSGARYTPVAVQIVGDGDRRDPLRQHASAGEGQGYGRYSDMVLGRAIIEQFATGDIVNRSCAVNAAAHEYAHTIATTPIGFTIAFTDTTGRQTRIADRQHPGTPVASYLIGAVAQCTWLQQKGRIDRSGLAACVEVFGVSAFNWKRCSQFADGQTVSPRGDLAAPAPAL